MLYKVEFRKLGNPEKQLFVTEYKLNESLKLTQREIQIILFLKQSESPQNIENLQKKVWGHNSNLETHTVETHIYRLRKKISEKFKDSSFINSTKKGYTI